MLIKNGELITKNQDFLTHNDYFGSIVENLNSFQWNEQDGGINSKYVETITENFKNHSSCKIIKQHFKYHNLSIFTHTTVEEAKKFIHDLKNNKAAGGEIPVKIFKSCCCIFGILIN